MHAMNLRCQEIALKAITFTTQWNLHPWEAVIISDDLLQSFRQTGVIHPPILIAREGGQFDIICGFKRLQFARQFAQLEKVECLVFPQNTAFSLLLETLLTDQGLTRPLTLAEKARFVDIASGFFNDKDIIKNYFGKLQIRKANSALLELRNILKLSTAIITEIHAGRLSEKMVVELINLRDDTDRSALTELFKTLAMGENKQKMFLALIRDFSYGQDSTLSACLKSPAIVEILDHPVLNTPQKIQHLHNYLRTQVFPLSSKADEDFRREVQRLNLPPEFTVSHSPSFEKDEVTLSITFKNSATCLNMAQKIKQLCADSHC
jgi:hypothetical protein